MTIEAFSRNIFWKSISHSRDNFYQSLTRVIQIRARMEECAQDQKLRRNSRAFVKKDSKANNAIVSINIFPPYK